MPVPTLEPKVAIKNLVKIKWIAGNVVGTIVPDFHTGWWNPLSLKPQLTFTGNDETFQGDSGYGAIGADGPVQIVNGVLFANCWATRDEGAGGVNPKQLVYDMARELRRIILANAVDVVADLEYVSVISIIDVPPATGEDPVVFRKAITVGFNWRTT